MMGGFEDGVGRELQVYGQLGERLPVDDHLALPFRQGGNFKLGARPGGNDVLHLHSAATVCGSLGKKSYALIFVAVFVCRVGWTRGLPGDRERARCAASMPGPAVPP